MEKTRELYYKHKPLIASVTSHLSPFVRGLF